MNTHCLKASRHALAAIKAATGDALVLSTQSDHPIPMLLRIDRTELAFRLKHVQHAALMYYIRCEASPHVLQLIRDATEIALQLFDNGDAEMLAALHLVEPCRHTLYANALISALLAAERMAISLESRCRETVRLVPQTFLKRDLLEQGMK